MEWINCELITVLHVSISLTYFSVHLMDYLNTDADKRILTRMK